MGFLLTPAGHATTANLIGSSALPLIDTPTRPSSGATTPPLAPPAVEELLRSPPPSPAAPPAPCWTTSRSRAPSCPRAPRSSG